MTFIKKHLDNGIRVMLVPHGGTTAVTTLALYEVGSRYESAKLNGASHFIEHMMFKGTRRRPATLDISRDLDAVGADYNAFTGKDYTGYYVKLQSEKMGLAVDLLDDMIYNSVYRADDVDSERQVILEELRMYEDNPIMFVEELVEEELYRGSPLGMRIGGTVKSVSGLTRAGLVEYRDRYYVPSRTVIAIAGNFEPEDALRMLNRKFGRRKGKGRPRAFTKAKKTGYTAPRVHVHERDTEQVQLAIGFPAYPYGHAKLPALSVLSTILGGTMSSRLFTAVREREGLCYFIRSAASPYQDIGDLTIQAGLAKDRFEKAMKIIIRELRRMKDRKVTNEELNRSKDYVRGKLALALEDSSRQADWYAKQELLMKKVMTPEQRLARIVKVTRDDVQRVANDVFRANRASIAVIGPFKKKRPFIDSINRL
ncbi:MAG: pitrilysin family protein [Patescibacteria group bacterium]|nr:pitrilysin family protein [Patescibacteria group bacterium]